LPISNTFSHIQNSPLPNAEGLLALPGRDPVSFPT
jgi:hypothetical protein